MKPVKRQVVICFCLPFGLDRAQTTIEFGICWSNLQIETFLLEYSTVV